MHEIFNRNLFLVKQHVGLFKASCAFDVYNPKSGELLIECREENLGLLTKLLRFTDYKRCTPFDIELRTPEGKRLLRVARGIPFLRSTVEVSDESGQVIGHFQQKLFTLLGESFNVLDADGQPVFTLKGKWTGWDFRFRAGDLELAHITKKWAGIGKEFFTDADNYVIEISDAVPQGSPARQLILGAVMCIDLVLKQR